MQINEKSVATFTIQPLDEDGDPRVPATMRYRLDDYSTGNAIIGWTDLTPAAVVTVQVPASAHAIINTLLAEEDKVLTVETDYGTELSHNEDFTYTVRNLQFVV